MRPITLDLVANSTVATVSVPGSKSYTNRALLIAAMTPGTVKIKKPLISDDTEAMLDCLMELGIKIIGFTDYLEVIGDISNISNGDYELNANLSGTTIRFMLALCTIIPGQQIVRGAEGLQKRPIGDIVDSLRALGAKIEYLGKEGYPPLRVNSSTLNPGSVTIKGNSSSQFLSALLMIAPMIGELTIETTGKVISKPYIDMTLVTMEHFSVSVSSDGYERFYIAPNQQYKAKEYVIEGDVSSASYFFAIAALTSSTITVSNMNPRSIQADMGFLEILEKSGNKVSRDKQSITVQGNGVRCATIDMEHCPDQAPTMAVLAAFAPGITTLTGVQSLRVKETERIVALEQELAKMGIQTKSTRGTLVIYGGSPQPAVIATYGDHRMAMSFAVAGTRLPGIKIQDPDVVSKTFPDFWKQLASLNHNSDIATPNIVLIGMRGSGKTTVAKKLAQTLHQDLLDIDSLIALEAGIPLAEIIARHGWDAFRNQESSIVEQVSSLRNKVISTGGGVILRPKNITALKKHGFVIWLNASENTLSKRLGDASDRPPLTDQKSLSAEIAQVMHDRQALYESAADVIIDTDTLSADQVATRILKLTKSKRL